MEKFFVGFSSKTIGPFSLNLYNKDLLSRIQEVLIRMRWKYIIFKADKHKKEMEKAKQCLELQNGIADNEIQRMGDEYENEFDQEDTYSDEYFGFKSTKHPPCQPEMTPFEEEVLGIAANLKTRKTSNTLQRNVLDLRRRLKGTNGVVVESDKTGNHFVMPVEDYDRKVLENITKDYKKATENIENNINREAAALAKSMKMDDRVHKMGRQEAYVTVKDHKPNFPARVSCRLINPCKTEMRRIS